MANKTVSVNIRVTEKQKELWDKFAKESNMSMPEFIRLCVGSYINATLKLRSKKVANTKKQC